MGAINHRLIGSINPRDFVKEITKIRITCPGVWLCPNGKVALQIKTLNAQVESGSVAPAFPLLFYDKFTFKKLFTGVSTLAELQSSLEDEFLYTELVQWSSHNSSAVVLATFETNLGDLLYPAPCFKGLLSGSEVDLLMEPTKYFPGILAPKIEVSTRTIIEEVIGVCNTTTSGCHVINPKVINSKNGTCVHRKRPTKGIIRQRQVCHTQGKTKPQPNRPQRQRHASADGTSASLTSTCNNHSQSQIEHCCHKSKGFLRSSNHPTVEKIREISPFRHSSHVFNNCPVCSKYECYFAQNCEPQIMGNSSDHRRESLHKIYESSKCSRHSCSERENNERKCRPRSAPHECSLRETSSSSILRAKTRQLPRNETKSNDVAADACEVDYFECERSQGRQGFYKNLEKFYKRMYKQAKIRAQEVDCT